jgi:cytochrome c oxidase subunit 2
MKRDVLIAAILWVLLTAVGIFLVLQINIFPASAAEEAEIIDDAFQLLLLLGTPVFTFVIAGLIYSFFRYRQSGETPEDGKPIHTNRFVTWTWFAITSGLAVFIVFNPGLKGIKELRSNLNSDLVVQVEARKWAWNYTYPEYDLTFDEAQELLLPVDRRVRFEITSMDILHSFWIPAFRMKVDAVPGQTNVLYVTPNQTGSFEDEFNIRVQCAELCGTGHPRMRTGLRILEQDAFDAWIEEQTSTNGQ